MSDEVQRLRDERDLYLRLLHLGADDDVVAFLDEALDLATRAAGADRGYLALPGAGGDVSSPRFWRVRGYGEEDAWRIRERCSTGIIAAALAEGRTVCTTEAAHDRRFRDRSSVQSFQIRAVACAPLVAGNRPFGVLYLQRERPGPFPKEAVAGLELVARALSGPAARVLRALESASGDDPTAPYRQRLAAEGIVGRSASMARTLGQLALAARSPLCVLLTGPTGSGKTTLARVLHDSGRRARGPFVAVNCANLHGDLAESTLFGHARGGFTGAVARREGQVLRAHDGTLLLDEVGDLPPATQARLLTFLDSGELLPVGGDEPVRADVRVVAATHRDLRHGGFREDLYYRLAGYEVRVPALAERAEDIPALARGFCQRYASREGPTGMELSQECTDTLSARSWPGNLRELEACVVRAVDQAAFEGASRVLPRHLDRAGDLPPVSPPPTGPGAASAAPSTGEPGPSLQERTRQAQREWIGEALAVSGGGVDEAARRLKVGRSRLYELIRDLGIERK